MAASKFAIVYASETKAIRRVIYPDNDKQQIAVLDGEEVLFCSVKESGDIDQWKALVEKATGVYPKDPVCAVVDGDTVVSLIMADPKLDTHPDGHDLVDVYSDKIAVGDKYDKAQAVFTKADTAERVERPVEAVRLK